MKKMDIEVKEFHSHMANSMSKLMKAFTDGFTALDKAKQDDPAGTAAPVKKAKAEVSLAKTIKKQVPVKTK
jgi:hypothetical protein